MRLFFLYYILIAFVLFSCAEQSAYEDAATSNKSAVTENNESTMLENNLEEDYFKLDSNTILTENQKEAFELRAIEKFQDFLDYVQLISNHKMNEKFRNHATKLSMELFINDSILIAYPEFTDRTESNLNDFLIRLKKYKDPLIIKIKHIEFITPFTLDTIGNYAGTMEVKLKIGKRKQTKKVAVHLVTISKDFGEIEKRITEVRLGNIY